MLLEYRKRKRNEQLLKAIPFPETGKLLDVSSGDGSFLHSLHGIRPNLELFGIDISVPKVPLPEISFQVANADKLPFPDQSFDIVNCSMSMHHYENGNLVLKEISRVVRSARVVYLTDIMPRNKVMQRLYNLMGCSSPYDFKRYYTEEDFKNMAEPLGFTITRTFRIMNFIRLRTLELHRKVA